MAVELQATVASVGTINAYLDRWYYEFRGVANASSRIDDAYLSTYPSYVTRMYSTCKSTSSVYSVVSLPLPFSPIPIASTSVYPDVVSDIKGVIPFQWGYQQRVAISTFTTGVESRRLVQNAPRKSVRIRYKYVTREEAQRLYNFYQQQQGAFRPFAFFFPNPQGYEKEYCGTYTGMTKNINLPSKVTNSSSYQQLYVGNTPVSNYTFNMGASPDTGDMAVLGGTPVIGDKYYLSFEGRLKIKARFSDNPIEIDELKNKYSSFTIELVGLEAEFV